MGNYKKTVVLLLLCLCLGACKKAEDRIQSYDSIVEKARSEEEKQEETNTASEKMQEKENEKSEQAEVGEFARSQSRNPEVESSGQGWSESAEQIASERSNRRKALDGILPSNLSSEGNGHLSDGKKLPAEERTLPPEEHGHSSGERTHTSEENARSPEGDTQPPGENTLPSDESTLPSEESSSDSGCEHEMVTSWYGEAPDCTHGGYRIVLCRLCGWVSGADSGSVDALEHTPVGQEIQHGNCREDTIIIYTCTACGQQVGYERYPEPGEHSWVYKEQQIWDEEKFAFITILVQVCERCNIQYQE